jgi:hypothetical protein
MTLKQIDAALAELLRLGLVEKVRDVEGVERFSPCGYGQSSRRDRGRVATPVEPTGR